MAVKTGNTYIAGTMTDRMTIPTANLGCSTTPSPKKLTPSDYDNDRQPEMAMQTFWVSIWQFLVFYQGSNNLSTLLSSSLLSKIRNLALEFRRFLPRNALQCKCGVLGSHVVRLPVCNVGGLSNQSNFIMKCDKRTQNIESSVRMTEQKNIKKQNT